MSLGVPPLIVSMICIVEGFLRNFFSDSKISLRNYPPCISSRIPLDCCFGNWDSYLDSSPFNQHADRNNINQRTVFYLDTNHKLHTELIHWKDFAAKQVRSNRNGYKVTLLEYQYIWNYSNNFCSSSILPRNLSELLLEIILKLFQELQ